MLAAAFLMGLVGSMHCIGMCGPLAVVANRMGHGQGALNSVIYNSSRIVVYILLGLLFGLLGQVAIVNGLQKWLSVALGGTIAILALTMIIKPQINNYLTGQFTFVFKWMGKFNKPGQKGFKSTALLGFINGFLPCGLVYMAVAGSIIQLTLVDSALYMLAFGLGTLPMMFSLTLSGNKLLSLVRGNYKRVLSVGLFAFGLFLVYRGLEMEFTAAVDNMFNPAGGVVECE